MRDLLFRHVDLGETERAGIRRRSQRVRLVTARSHHVCHNELGIGAGFLCRHGLDRLTRLSLRRGLLRLLTRLVLVLGSELDQCVIFSS